MKEEEKESYIVYRIESAFESLDTAKILIKNKKWNGAINRLYYAVYHSASALLLLNGITTKTHSGIKGQLFLNYIKTEIIDIKYGKLYTQLFNWRQKGDCGDFFNFTEEDVKPLIEPVNDFLKIINDILQADTN